MTMTYAEFQATDAYRMPLAGAQLSVRFTCEQDTSVVLIGTASFGVEADVEKLSIEEGGNEGVTEIVTGRINFRLNGSVFLTSYRMDQGVTPTRTPTTAAFLTTRKSWTVEVYDGPRFPGAVDASPKDRFRYACTGFNIERQSFNHSARGDVQGQIEGPCKYLYSGAEWALATAG